MAVPKRIRAAFPLDFYQNKIACVISDDAFESLEGYILIFHEFMHCNQWEICEPKLKQKLGIYKEALKEKNYSWELNYPFPFSNPKFVKIYSNFMDALDKGKKEDIFDLRKELKEILSKDDFEYMVWQEWKEGFTRFIENKIRKRLGVEENHRGKDQPFSRVTFYEGGAKFIEYLSKNNPSLLVNIEELFYTIIR